MLGAAGPAASHRARGAGRCQAVSVPVLLPPTLYCRGDMGLFRAVARVNAGSFGRPQATATART